MRVVTPPLRRRLDRCLVPFVRALASHGDRPALVTTTTTLSYRDLSDRVVVAAHALGTTRRLVLLNVAPELDVVVTYLACLAAGHPVLLTAGDAETEESLRETYDPDVVVSATAGTVTIDQRHEGSAHWLHSDLVLLLSTSGSTGSPKLVRLGGDIVQSNAAAIAASLAIRGTDRAITSMPLHYCYGLSVLHSHLLKGAATILTPLSVADPCFWALFREQAATTFAGVPHTFALLERAGFADMDLPRLRYITQAGGRLAPERVRQMAELGKRRGWDFVVMYGQTEATARMAYLPPDLTSTHPYAIGIPVPGGAFHLEPYDDAPGPDVGELVYCGPNVMMGYATSAADLSLGRAVDQLRTGDLARQTADGLYELVGRRSQFLKIFGLRIDLDRVATALAGPGVSVACLGSDEQLVVAVAGSTDLEALHRRAAHASGLPRAAIRICPLAELPRLATGKLDRAALQQMTTALPAAEQPPPSSVREVLALVLQRDDVTDESSFVELGGDSLSYVEASLQLEDLLGHLPADWHLLSVVTLQATQQRRERRGRVVETGVLLRAVAIVLIVAQHAHAFRVLGGAHLLLGVAGFNFARFLLTATPRRERLGRILRSAARIAVPTLPVIAAGMLLLGHYGWQHLLLVHDLVAPGDDYSHFWFVEVLVQLLVVAAVLLAVPALDRLERRWPLALPLALMAPALLARFDVIALGSFSGRLSAPFAIVWLFLWGWAAAKATTTRQRQLLSAVLLVALPGFLHDNIQRELVVGAALVLLAWMPSLRVPRWLVPVVGVLATSSLYVYVTHYLVLPGLYGLPVLAMVASFAVGIAYWQLATRAMSGLEHVLDRGRALARRQFMSLRGER